MVSVNVKHHVYLLTSTPPLPPHIPVPNKPYGFCDVTTPPLYTPPSIPTSSEPMTKQTPGENNFLDVSVWPAVAVVTN